MRADFISNEDLRQRINDSIEYILTLYEESKENNNQLYREETYRVIVLYAVQILEALLFAIYQERNNNINKIEYKEKVSLPSSYINKQCDGPVIFAIEKSTSKKEVEIGFHELVNFLVEENVLKQTTADQIIATNSMRNTFHLRKERLQKCTVEDVEMALSLVSRALDHTPRFIK